jgi:hypothetical protein
LRSRAGIEGADVAPVARGFDGALFFRESRPKSRARPRENRRALSRRNRLAMEEHDRERAPERAAAARASITFDLELLRDVVDVRPDAAALLCEREWTERHLAAARRVLRTDFDPKSLAVFEQILAGERVAQVAQRFGLSDQAVYKIKQRVAKRLTELVRRSIEIEEHRD